MVTPLKNFFFLSLFKVETLTSVSLSISLSDIFGNDLTLIEQNLTVLNSSKDHPALNLIFTKERSA
jgi:hypothetical protein